MKKKDEKITIPLSYKPETIRAIKRRDKKNTVKITLEIDRDTREWLDNFFKDYYPELRYTLTGVIDHSLGAFREVVESGVMPLNKWREWFKYFHIHILKRIDNAQYRKHAKKCKILTD